MIKVFPIILVKLSDTYASNIIHGRCHGNNCLCYLFCYSLLLVHSAFIFLPGEMLLELFLFILGSVLTMNQWFRMLPNG